MGREVRRVAPQWEHPRLAGTFRPLDTGYSAAVAEWEEGRRRWAEGLIPHGVDGWRTRTAQDDADYGSYRDYAGDQPDPDDYMPEWSAAEATHWQMYTTTCGGQPISPVCATVEDMCRALAASRDRDATLFAGRRGSYEDWMQVVRDGGYFPTFVKVA